MPGRDADDDGPGLDASDRTLPLWRRSKKACCDSTSWSMARVCSPRVGRSEYSPCMNMRDSSSRRFIRASKMGLRSKEALVLVIRVEDASGAGARARRA